MVRQLFLILGLAFISIVLLWGVFGLTLNLLFVVLGIVGLSTALNLGGAILLGRWLDKHAALQGNNEIKMNK